MFNPQPRVQNVGLADGQRCIVVDDALVQPRRLVELAMRQREKFGSAPFNAYPGVELPLTDAITQALHQFFDRHVRGLLHGRRTLRMNCRLALTTRPAQELEPRQWLCHRDSAWVAPQHCIAAAVLYLFEDPALGGTGFYRSRLSDAETDLLVHDSSTQDAAVFSAKYNLSPAYMTGSNAYFDRIGGVAAKFNRLIFYDGRTFHSADLAPGPALSNDPALGRLTLNGFFTCTRKAAGCA